MPEVRFDVVYYPGDGIYRTLDYFLDNLNFDWLNSTTNKDRLLAEAQQTAMSRASLDWLKENVDLRREPPMRSHARGLMSRFNMDKLDGIDVRKVLENNPGFYSLSSEETNHTVLHEGEPMLTECGGGARENTPVLIEGDDRKTETFIAEKTKISLKNKLKHFFRRLCCLPLTAEE